MREVPRDQDRFDDQLNMGALPPKPAAKPAADESQGLGNCGPEELVGVKFAVAGAVGLQCARSRST